MVFVGGDWVWFGGCGVYFCGEFVDGVNDVVFYIECLKMFCFYIVYGI